MQSQQCLECKNFDGGNICKAYPKGIPEEILTGEHDHTQPFAGDNGIRFEPLPALKGGSKSVTQ